MSKTIAPIIKWTGTKRHVAEEIVSRFPKEINTYYEPFIGGGSIMVRLLTSDVKVNRVCCSDINPDLINLWALIKTNPKYLLQYYSEWRNKFAQIDRVDMRKELFYSSRRMFNEQKKPEQFFTLLRMSYNGLIRYNNKGEFNAPYHFGRLGIHPQTLEPILNFWHTIVQGVEFIHRSYDEIKPAASDFVFIDPPYFNVSSSIYNGKIDKNQFTNFLAGLKCRYVITLDGKNSNDDRTCTLPKTLYKTHEYTKARYAD